MNFTVSFIGSGRVASALAGAFRSKGAAIGKIYSRNPVTAAALAQETGAQQAATVHEIDGADLVVVAVQDDEIAPAVAGWHTQALVVHTSGASELQILENTSHKTGVAWPIQTFSAGASTGFEQTPIVLEANSPAVMQELKDRFGMLSNHLHVADFETRLYLHTCAVFANNFSNHCMNIAEKLLTEKGYGFDLLRPMLKSQHALLDSKNPGSMQTGPAARGDRAVLEKHLRLLAHHPDFAALYRALSESIIRLHSKP